MLGLLNFLEVNGHQSHQVLVLFIETNQLIAGPVKKPSYLVGFMIVVNIRLAIIRMERVATEFAKPLLGLVHLPFLLKSDAVAMLQNSTRGIVPVVGV